MPALQALLLVKNSLPDLVGVLRKTFSKNVKARSVDDLRHVKIICEILTSRNERDREDEGEFSEKGNFQAMFGPFSPSHSRLRSGVTDC